MRFAITLLTCVCFGSGVANAATSQWERIEADVGETSFVAVAVDPLAPSRIVAATSRTVYESTDGGLTWGEQLRVPGPTTVSALALGRAQPIILVATNRGLYGSFDGGSHWSRLFRGRDESQARCAIIAFHPQRPGTILLGTDGGLFRSDDTGRRWHPVATPSIAQPVVHLAFHPGDGDWLYLVTPQRLFASHLVTGEWQELFNLQGTAEEVLDATDPADTIHPAGVELEEAPNHRLTAAALDPAHPTTVYLASTRGVVVSQDGGTSWQWTTRLGLVSPSVTHLVVQRHSPLRLYAATMRGVARYDPQQLQWEVITQGLSSAKVNDLAVTADRLWAATDHGLYQAPMLPDPWVEPAPPTAQELLSNFSHEPTMSEIREAAIRYAEVAPEKIARWRRQAALKALLPSVDVGIDRDHSRTAHYDEGTFPKFQIIETDDRDTGVDFSINWELGDLLWNDDQTSIDVRSKLMVQLRNDIVDEVTRTYYERRRLQVALLTDPPEDPHEILDKELRIQELTALIDGLTGGYFSKRTEIK